MSEVKDMARLVCVLREEKFKRIFPFIKTYHMSFDDCCLIHDQAASVSARDFAFARMLALVESFEKWEEVFRKIGEMEEVIILEKMVSLAQTFAHWSSIYSHASEKSDFKVLAFQKMTELATSFREWREIHDHIIRESELKTCAFETMLKLAIEPQELFEVFSRASEENKVTVLEKMDQCEPSAEWLTIFNQVPSDSQIEQLAFEKVSAFL